MGLACAQLAGIKRKLKWGLLQHSDSAIQLIFDLGYFVVANLNRRHHFDLAGGQIARLGRLPILSKRNLRNVWFDGETGAKRTIRDQLAPQAS